MAILLSNKVELAKNVLEINKEKKEIGSLYIEWNVNLLKRHNNIQYIFK